MPAPAKMMPQPMSARRELAQRVMPAANGSESSRINSGLSDCVQAGGISTPPMVRLRR